jgi:hypothetical protein
MHDLVDIGVNLGHRQFGSDRDAVIGRAQAAGVRRMVVTGTSVEATRSAVALARERPGILFATAGIHPHDASRATPEALGKIADLARTSDVRRSQCGPTSTGTPRRGPPRSRARGSVEPRERRLPRVPERAPTTALAIPPASAPPRRRSSTLHCARELDAYLAHDLALIHRVDPGRAPGHGPSAGSSHPLRPAG